MNLSPDNHAKTCLNANFIANKDAANISICLKEECKREKRFNPNLFDLFLLL